MEEIEIRNSSELLKLMESEKLYVEWSVTSDIGPDWIGSETEIDFYTDHHCLVENSFIVGLSESVKKSVELPETGGDRIIRGEGVVNLKNGQLHLQYSWSSEYPYMNPDKFGKGEVTINA